MTNVRRDLDYAVTIIIYSRSANADIQATLNGQKVEVKSQVSQFMPALKWFRGASEGKTMDLAGKISDGIDNAESKITVSVYEQACDSGERQTQVVESEMLTITHFLSRCIPATSR